ncbi:hypothetical protein AB0M12_04950 [Nocardia vinacea]|uniref:hypothetical protein n=1 Tax=Nocardia vinacea TaxID=96468 RepID=UPI0034326C32
MRIISRLGRASSPEMPPGCDRRASWSGQTLTQIALGTRYSELEPIAADTVVRRMRELADCATEARNPPEFLADKTKP